MIWIFEKDQLNFPDKFNTITIDFSNLKLTFWNFVGVL